MTSNYRSLIKEKKEKKKTAFNISLIIDLENSTMAISVVQCPLINEHHIFLAGATDFIAYHIKMNPYAKFGAFV